MKSETIYDRKFNNKEVMEKPFVFEKLHLELLEVAFIGQLVNCLGRHFAGKIDFRFYFFKELI
jgi:hypothetical protein